MSSQHKAKKPKENQDDSIKLPDPIAFSKAMAEAWERALPLMSEYMERYSTNMENQSLDPFNVRQAYLDFIEKASEDPQHLIKLQTEYWDSWLHIWQESMKKFLGETSEETIKPEAKDRRFRAPEWQENALFDFIKQSYLLTCQSMTKMIEETDGLKEEDKKSSNSIPSFTPTRFRLPILYLLTPRCSKRLSLRVVKIL